jgi:glycerol-3-phosphate dehydrogenase
MDQVFDLAIIGGGINGCGCAGDAALRGLSVILLEQEDIASKTSSSSTKLIHGGLRYLEHYEFKLVKKAIAERQRLLSLAPHLVHPQALVLPLKQPMRPSWVLRLGLFIYDNLSYKNNLPKSKSIYRKNKNNYFIPLKEEINEGFLFYDASTDDARLALTNALQAKIHGANIKTYSRVIQARVINKMWELTIQPTIGSPYTIFAKALINAAGPWVKSVEHLTPLSNPQKISLVKGSHIIVPKLYEGNHAYLLQNQDKRVIFVIPYHGFSMIGTTEVPLTEMEDKVSISTEEIYYLIDLINQYFKVTMTQSDIISSWSGVRSLLANDKKKVQTLSRDYNYRFNPNPAPIVTIYGGKITTYRQLAEEVIDQLADVFPNMNSSNTAITPLPGATLETMDFEHYSIYAKEKYQWMDPQLLNRYLYTYGTRLEHFLSACTQEQDLGKKYGSNLYQVEVDYLISEEWVRTCEDLLKRRTKLDFVLDEASKNELTAYIKKITAASHPAQTELLSH